MLTEEEIKDLKLYGNSLVLAGSIFYKNKKDKIQYIKITEYEINSQLQDFEIKGINLFDDDWTGKSYYYNSNQVSNIGDFIFFQIDKYRLSMKDSETINDFIKLNNKLIKRDK